MEIEILPCPNPKCGATCDVGVAWGAYHVFCNRRHASCGYRGPSAVMDASLSDDAMKSAAIAAHNALAAAVRDHAEAAEARVAELEAQVAQLRKAGQKAARAMEIASTIDCIEAGGIMRAALSATAPAGEEADRG